ncbi:MAG: DUF1467 family protein [Proteobacteria bacterium]|nr:DUF1467 family protein [Pseudomonadota bacterium]
MDWFTGIIAYLLIWWTALFAVLPWGNRMAENLVPGQVHSAPDIPNLKKKFLITTVVAAMLWVFLFILIKADIIDFRQIAGTMMAEDTRP